MIQFWAEPTEIHQDWGEEKPGQLMYIIGDILLFIEGTPVVLLSRIYYYAQGCQSSADQRFCVFMFY